MVALAMTRAKKAFRMWQWNCRSYKNKKPVLQETHGIAKLAGYRSFGYAERQTRALTTLVKRSIVCVQHNTGIEHIDNVLLERTGLGQRTYNYIKSFLSDRKTVISIGGLKLHEIDIGGAGMPQGSVLSPMLFNLILIGLPKKLNETESLHH